MQTYETLLITPPNLAEEDEKTAVDALLAIITDGGGKMHAQDRMGRRHLAYPIQKFEDGVYFRFLYEAEAAVPKELERRSRISDKFLRSLTVRLTKEWAEDAKKQAVIDAQRRIEMAEQAILDAEAKVLADAEAAVKAEADAKSEAEKAAQAGAAAAARAAHEDTAAGSEVDDEDWDSDADADDDDDYKSEA